MDNQNQLLDDLGSIKGQTELDIALLKLKKKYFFAGGIGLLFVALMNYYNLLGWDDEKKQLTLLACQLILTIYQLFVYKPTVFTVMFGEIKDSMQNIALKFVGMVVIFFVLGFGIVFISTAIWLLHSIVWILAYVVVDLLAATSAKNFLIDYYIHFVLYTSSITFLIVLYFVEKSRW